MKDNNQDEGGNSSQPSRKRSHSEAIGDDDIRFHLAHADHHHKGHPTSLVPDEQGNKGESSNGNQDNVPTMTSSIEATSSKNQASTRPIEKSRKQVLNEIYMSLVTEMMYPNVELSSYGYEPEKNRYPFDRVNTLGYLLNPLRNRTVFEKWSPYEIAVFEGSITLYGKNFHTIHQQIQTKTVKEVIEFYYEWKKTPHYKEWKKQYFPDLRDFE